MPGLGAERQHIDHDLKYNTALEALCRSEGGSPPYQRPLLL